MGIVQVPDPPECRPERKRGEPSPEPAVWIDRRNPIRDVLGERQGHLVEPVDVDDDVELAS